MRKEAVLFLLIILCTSHLLWGQTNYHNYHGQVIQSEEHIVEKAYASAIENYRNLFGSYEFIFLRDIKVATEVSVKAGNYNSSFEFLQLGLKNGWSLKKIKRNKRLKILKKDPRWKSLESNADKFLESYQTGFNSEVKEQVRILFKKDQKMALAAFIRPGQKAKTRYAETKFAPHSEQQLSKLRKIIRDYGYPGERLIGNDIWASTILSHHNSISPDYNARDTLFNQLYPDLLQALKKGEISPQELAHIVDWRTAVVNHHEETTYGFLGSITSTQSYEEINVNRLKIGLRSLQLRNQLIDVEKETGMNLYLPKGWQNGKIE